MAVGLGLEAKKLRWLWRRGDPISSLASPHLPPSLPKGTHYWMLWLLVGHKIPEHPVHPTHPTLPGLTAGGLSIFHPPVQVKFLGQSSPVSTPGTGWVQAGDDLLPNEEGDLEGTGAH